MINLALDLQANGAILRGLLEPTPGILGRLYRHDRYPELLLRPPTDLFDQLAGGDPEAQVFSGYTMRELAGILDGDPLARARVEAILEAHLSRLAGVDRPQSMARVYLDGWCQPQESRSWLLRFLRLMSRKRYSAKWHDITLLGDHRRRRDAKTNRWSRAWGWSRSRRADELVLDLEPPPAVLLERFQRAAQRAMQPWLENSESPPPASSTSIIPNPGRREQVLRAAGITPIVYQHHQPTQPEPKQMVHLYLDVSGSMAGKTNWYGGLARVLGERLAEPVWTWSTQVEEASRGEVLRGRVRTHGGTCIEPVVEHAIEQGFHRILVLSDGEFGVESDRLSQAVRGAGLELVVLLLRGRRRPTSLEHLEQIAVDVTEVRC